jgi:hypothetical protein
MSETPLIVVGDAVVVHGLQERTELNVQTGTLLLFDASKGCWPIQFAKGIVSSPAAPAPPHCGHGRLIGSDYIDFLRQC